MEVLMAQSAGEQFNLVEQQDGSASRLFTRAYRLYL
jgi:hypothetical protein